MDEPYDILAQEAAERLIALGWPVVPVGDDMEEWQVGRAVFTDAELLEFAAWMGIAFVGTDDSARVR